MRGSYTPGLLHSPEDVLKQVFSSLTSTGPLVLSAETVKSLWKLRGRGGKRESKKTASGCLLKQVISIWVACNTFSNCLYSEFSLSWGESLWELSISWRRRGRQRMRWLDGITDSMDVESEWTPGDGDGQGGLACCDSWGRWESDTTERLNWTELNWTYLCYITGVVLNFRLYLDWDK